LDLSASCPAGRASPKYSSPRRAGEFRSSFSTSNRNSTMTTPESVYRTPEALRAQFHNQLCEMAVAVGIPLVFPRPLLSLPSQRAAHSYKSDKAGAEDFLMSLRPKRVLLGKSSKGFSKDEVLLALDKAVDSEMSTSIIEALLQLAETVGASSGITDSGFTTDKKGHAIPTIGYLFTKAERPRPHQIWQLFLGRVSQKSLDASLDSALKSRPNDIERIRSLLEYGANPELCQDEILELIASRSEELVELLLLSPLLNSVNILNNGLVKAAHCQSLRISSMLLLKGADANFNQANALKVAVSSQNYEVALAIVTISKKAVSSGNLDEATSLMSSWSQEEQKAFIKILLYAGATGPRMSKALVAFIIPQEDDIASVLIECAAFRHSTFPAPRLFQFAVNTRNPTLALQLLRSSSNKSFTDYVNTGVHLELVTTYSTNAEKSHKIITELLALGVAGDYTSEMLISCCTVEQIQTPHIMDLIHLLIHTGSAKADYRNGLPLRLAIQAADTVVISALMDSKPSKQILSSAVSYTSSFIGSENPAKLEIWSILLDAGASGHSVDQELVSAINKEPHSLDEVKVLLKGASLDYSEGKPIMTAVHSERLDILETMLSEESPKSLTFTSIWKQVRTLFALGETEGQLPYSLRHMQKTFEILHASAKTTTPVNELLLDATRCASAEIALLLSKLFLRWGASPNHALGSPLQACIKRSDTKTLAALLSVETSKTSLKYAFGEALLKRQNARYVMLETIIAAGLERTFLDAALPSVLNEDPYDFPTVHLLVGAGATLHSSFGESLVPPSRNLDLYVVEKLLPAVVDKDSLLLPLKAVLRSHTDWQSPDGESLPIVKFLVHNCKRGTWADGCFITGVRSRNRHSSHIFAKHLTSKRIYSDALREVLVPGTTPLNRDNLSMTQYLLGNGARGHVIDEFFVFAAQELVLEWVSALYPYISDRSVALSAFDILTKGKEASTDLSENRLEIIQFLLKNGLNGPTVDKAFVRAASAADLSSMNQFYAFISSPDAFSESLDMLAQKEELLMSSEGLAATELLLRRGASDVSVSNAVKVAARGCNATCVKLIIGMTQTNLVIHAAFQGLLETTERFTSPESRAILFFLLENGLSTEDTEHVARLAASIYDVDIIKALASLNNYGDLHKCAVEVVTLAGDKWLSHDGFEFVEYLLQDGISGVAIHRLIEEASKALNLPALRLLLSACDERDKAVKMAFGSVMSHRKRDWTSPEGLHIINFLLGLGATGTEVEAAAEYAARTSNYDALNVFLESPVAAVVIPAAFKGLMRDSHGQLSSEQLTIASMLVKQGVSTEILAIAAIECSKLIDIEGLKVLSKSPRFSQVTDEIIRAIFLTEELWRSPGGFLVTRFLIEKGVSTKMVEMAAAKASASMDIDALRNIVELCSASSFTVIESAFISMTGLGNRWLCPEGLRIMEYLLHRGPSPSSINKAFIQASKHLHFDAVQHLYPYISEISVFNEALFCAVGEESEWLSALHLIQLLLNSGVEGEAVERAFIRGARALDDASLKLLGPRINRPEVYTKALSAATENTPGWQHQLGLIEFLLHGGAKGEPVEKAYTAASKSLDLPAVTLLNPYVSNPDTHNQAFRGATSNENWLSPRYLELIEFLYVNTVTNDALEAALVSAAEALNVNAIVLLSKRADENMCTQAFTAATRDIDKWSSEEGSQVVRILAKKGARGDSVDKAFISSARLFRIDLVTVLAQNIDKKNHSCVSLALNALLSTHNSDSPNSGKLWLSHPDALDVLQMLVHMGAKSVAANDALVLAAQHGNIRAVNILCQVVNDPPAFTTAFTSMTTSGTLWLQDDYLDLVSTLLSRGTTDKGIHYALIDAVAHVIKGVASEQLLDMLLCHKADVNFERGKSLQLTTQYGRHDLFEKLLQRGPNSLSLYMSLQASLNSGHEEDTVYRFFKSVVENESVHEKPDINYQSEQDFPLIFWCVNNYPNSSRLVKEICKLNADLSATILWSLNDDFDEPTSQKLPPLFVSLDKNCSDEVIDVLLEYGGKFIVISLIFQINAKFNTADIHFTPAQSQTSALMLAAGKGRASVVSTLLDRGASVIQKDARDRTSLCYSARCGNLSTMGSILKKNPPRNDGSLHEAARELHADAVKLLVDASHDIDFPSAKHGGRSPLCELCLGCKGFRDPTGLYNTLAVLAASKAQCLRKCRGRTAIFMAMENANPTPVVTALIEVCLWRDLNDDQNIYEEGDYFYSPTMYIKKDKIQQPEATAKDILEKLQDFSAVDKYYAKERMQQPRDAVGMPRRLLDLDHKKWIRSSRLEEEDEDFQRKLKRADQEMANRQLLSQRNHLMLMEQRENLGQQQSEHVLDNHLMSMKLRDREHGQRLVHQEELYDRRLGEMAAENKMNLNIQTGQHENKFGIQQQNREAELLHNSRTQEQKLSYISREQGMEFSSLEAKQTLRLGGITNELGLKQQQHADELRFRESQSGINRAELDRKLQHISNMNTEQVQLNRQLGNIQLDSTTRMNMLEDANRQSQQQHQSATNERKISTQATINEQEHARNQDFLNTRRMQGQIETVTLQALGQIKNDTIADQNQLTQHDRDHKLETDRIAAQIQSQSLQGRLEFQRASGEMGLMHQAHSNRLEQQNLVNKIQGAAMMQNAGNPGVYTSYIDGTHNRQFRRLT
jgi:hypothetical protein